MTKIEWTDKTWSPTVGCSPASTGCEHCFAARMAHRLAGIEKTRAAYEGLTVKGKHGPRWTGKVRCLPDRLDQPLRWRKPQRIFVNSMSDLFHEAVSDDFIAQVYGVMAVAGAGFRDSFPPNQSFGGVWRDSKMVNRHGPHVFQVLTKRPACSYSLLTSARFRNTVASAVYKWAHDRRDAGYLSDAIGTRQCNGYDSPVGTEGTAWPLSNVHLYASCEDQKTADERIPLLLQTPAAVRGLSLEPLLGPIDLHAVPWKHGGMQAKGWTGVLPVPDEPDDYVYWEQKGALQHVIVGGESGPGARPCNVEWIRSIVRQCAEAGVPVFVKQDSGPKPGQQGRIPDELWIKELPDVN